MDFDLQPKPASKLISLITQTISLFNSMDFDSPSKPESKPLPRIAKRFSVVNSIYVDPLPKPLRELISFISKKILAPDKKPESDLSFKSLALDTIRFKSEFILLIRQIVSVVISMNTELTPLIS
ncbi:unnamed protein product [Microthlaspi erraticum]|uniref:Uncharacterized protein n=1 Tax=Microthlaspi erraticum TaxID=1685480 RepID=A0A6D2IEQ5_9BRAS|nr:unnamed protein product [Microthlaspi erraticum]